MRAIKFKEATNNVAENQPEYITLPAFYGQLGEHPKQTGLVTCWELSLEEIENVNRYGKIWHTQLTFGEPMQPIMLLPCNDFFQPGYDNAPVTVLDFEQMENERFAWSVETFPGSTTQSALDHLKDEIKEIEAEPTDLTEYADSLALIMEAAGRAGFTSRQVLIAYRDKMEINRGRKWMRLENGSYKHVKEA
jgi:hypothetical protein